MIEGKSEQIKKVLGQLLKYTEQLARSEHDPGVDVKALARSCEKQLSVLKKLLPPGTDFRKGAVGNEDRGQLLGLLHVVNDRTENCIRIFRAAKTRLEKEMGAMRRSRRVAKAYRPPARPPRSRFSGAIA